MPVTIRPLEKKEMQTAIASQFLEEVGTTDLVKTIERSLVSVGENVIPWTVRSAGLVYQMVEGPLTISQNTDDFYRDMCSVRFQCHMTPTLEGLTAWENMTGGRWFEGNPIEFCQVLEDHGRLYAEAYYTTMGIDRPSKHDHDIMVSTILKLAGTNRAFRSFVFWPTLEYDSTELTTWDELRWVCQKNGVDSMLAAYEAGVPIDDIIA